MDSERILTLKSEFVGIMITYFYVAGGEKICALCFDFKLKMNSHCGKLNEFEVFKREPSDLFWSFIWIVARLIILDVYLVIHSVLH